ncbi:dihydropteroate synthase [Methylocapsa acidiphila]|uniref:dihydropteroate synthase n=1 Tax=Methylocapsa acidiphila TaxID=133552 RepID=UPI00047A4B29|nr:dihydropteroate synthase [Methylocapsa acidiphila]
MAGAAAARRDAFLARAGKHPLVMGIVNVTPDSFSDGGRFQEASAAVAQARRLVEDGADIIDVGAESTRPGHQPVSAEVEQARLAPLLGELVAAIDRPVSVDTSKAAIAGWAATQGAAFVNDVWGLQRDPAMADVAAEAGLGVIIMHNREEVDPGCDIVADMRRFFDHSLKLAAKAGIPLSRIILDPGIGFGKTRAQNLEALHRLTALRDYDLPVLVGVSRKSLLGPILGDGADHRLIGTIAANLVAAAHGASIFRVHDAAEHVAAFKVFEAIETA